MLVWPCFQSQANELFSFVILPEKGNLKVAGESKAGDIFIRILEVDHRLLESRERLKARSRSSVRDEVDLIFSQ